MMRAWYLLFGTCPHEIKRWKCILCSIDAAHGWEKR